jgi:membrane-associated protease RseP (regulator of RpoE activity)
MLFLIAVMNSLPFPPVDGGKLFVTLLFNKALKKPLTERYETLIYGGGTALFALFFIAVLVLDISRVRHGG